MSDEKMGEHHETATGIPAPTVESDGSAPEWSAAFQDVKCARCGCQYRCTPRHDYYNSTCATDGVCESCMWAQYRERTQR